LKLSELVQRAEKLGVADDKISEALDGEHPKPALIFVVRSKQLESLKLSELRHLAENIGARSADIDEAIDMEKPRPALIALIVSKEYPKAQN